MKMVQMQKRMDQLIPLHIPFSFVCETRPQRTAYVDLSKNKSFTYEELGLKINRMANALKSEGIGYGDLVMSSVFNSVDAIIANYATWTVGAIYCPISYFLAAGQIAYCMKDSQPKFYLYDEWLVETAQDALQMSEWKPTKCLCTNDMNSYLTQFSSDSCGSPPELGAFDEAIRLYTSGTTGMPKGVPHCHMDAYICGLTHSLYGMHWTPNDRLLVIAPYFHAAGNLPSYVPALSSGMTVVSMKKFDPKTTLKSVEDIGVTFMLGPPTAFDALVKEVQNGYQGNFASFRAAMLMGAPIPVQLYRSLRDVFGIEIFNGDGCTEALYCHTLSPWDPPEKWEGEATAKNGIALPGNLIRVVKQYPHKKADPDDIVPRDGETVGELIVKNVHHPGLYLNLPEKSKQTFQNGWYYSGDSATWDQDSYNHLVGRSDDRILSGGENIYPEEVESRILEHPWVADCVVVGVPDPKWGQLVTAYVSSADPSLTKEELDAFLKANKYLENYKRPRLYLFTKTLPYTATGKKQRYIVRKQALEDADQGRLERIFERERE